MFLWFLFIYREFPWISHCHPLPTSIAGFFCGSVHLSNPSMDPSHETPGKPSKTRCASPGGWRRGSGLSSWSWDSRPIMAHLRPREILRTWPQQRHPKWSNRHQIGLPHHRWPTRGDPHPSRSPPGASVPRVWWFNPMGVLWEIRTMDVLICIDRRDSSTPVSSKFSVNIKSIAWGILWPPASTTLHAQLLEVTCL